MDERGLGPWFGLGRVTIIIIVVVAIALCIVGGLGLLGGVDISTI